MELIENFEAPYFKLLNDAKLASIELELTRCRISQIHQKIKRLDPFITGVFCIP